MGGQKIVSNKLKAVGTKHWTGYFESPTSTNEVGFTALPSGFRSSQGTFEDVDYEAFWWSIILDTAPYEPRVRRLGNFSGLDQYYFYEKSAAYSVRCIKN